MDTSIDYKNSTKTLPRPNTLEIPRLILWMSPKPDLRHKPLDKDKKIRYQGLGVVSCGSLWWKKSQNKTNEKSKVLPSVRAESWGCEGRSPTSERFLVFEMLRAQLRGFVNIGYINIIAIAFYFSCPIWGFLGHVFVVLISVFQHLPPELISQATMHDSSWQQLKSILFGHWLGKDIIAGGSQSGATLSVHQSVSSPTFNRKWCGDTD